VTPTPLENAALELLVGGDDTNLAALRLQMEHLQVTRREFTGVGFFTFFQVPNEAPAATGLDVSDLSDVFGEVVGLPHPVGFILFLRDGFLECLECWIVDDEWPEPAVLKRAYYMRPVSGTSGGLVEVSTRAVRWALSRPLPNKRQEPTRRMIQK
jgi:hypothetical protein